jgi:hypothetical protein
MIYKEGCFPNPNKCIMTGILKVAMYIDIGILFNPGFNGRHHVGLSQWP